MILSSKELARYICVHLQTPEQIWGKYGFFNPSSSQAGLASYRIKLFESDSGVPFALSMSRNSMTRLKIMNYLKTTLG